MITPFQNKKPTIFRSVSLLAPHHQSDHIQAVVHCLLMSSEQYYVFKGSQVLASERAGNTWWALHFISLHVWRSRCIILTFFIKYHL